MSVTKRSRHCPTCDSEDIYIIGSVEAGTVPGLREDAYIYSCSDCGGEWDTESPEYDSSI